MGRGTTLRFPGVQARESSIRIWFMWKGARKWETLKMPPTPANLKQASKMREEIQTRIAIGAFDYIEFFPDSQTAKDQEQKESGPTFREMAQKWLAANSHLAASTLYDYNKRLTLHIYPIIGDVPIKKIVYSDLAALLGGIEWKSMKSRNNTATVIRQPFETAFLDGIIDINPAARIRNQKSQKDPPDPFSLDEVNIAVDELRQSSEHYANYFEFAFFTGLRTSELLALTWDDVDFVNAFVRVSKAKVLGEIKGTKTASVRDVELNSRAMAALKRQKTHTYLSGGTVFTNPNTGDSISNDYVVSLPWKRALKSAGLRYRNPYQTRHTFATLNLMAGANPMWVSRQMGHTSMKMLLEVYSRWIDQADRSREKNKLESLLSVPNVCHETKTAA